MTRPIHLYPIHTHMISIQTEVRPKKIYWLKAQLLWFSWNTVKKWHDSREEYVSHTKLFPSIDRNSRSWDSRHYIFFETILIMIILKSTDGVCYTFARKRIINVCWLYLSTVSIHYFILVVHSNRLDFSYLISGVFFLFNILFCISLSFFLVF